MAKRWIINYEGNKPYFEDEKGNKSETFQRAYNYINGWALVQLHNNFYAFRDINGNISESYQDAWGYNDGFACVQLDDGSLAYRDILGNVSTKKTRLGEEIYKYYNGEISAFDLSDEVFKDSKALSFVIKHTKEMAKEALEFVSTQGELDATKDYFGSLIDYTKDKAYDLYEEKEEEKEERKWMAEREEVEAQKQQAREELTF